MTTTDIPASRGRQGTARKEDARLITGQTNWTDNITLPGLLHVAFLRSPHAHARITSVDVSAARQAPGVIAAYSGADFAAEQGVAALRLAGHAGHRHPRAPVDGGGHRPVRRRDRGRRRGPRPVRRRRRARADRRDRTSRSSRCSTWRRRSPPGSPKVHEAGNKSFTWPFGKGDLDAAFRDAPVVIERTYRQQRLIPSAMEPRAVVCAPVGDEYTMWTSTQIPHVLRVMLALVTGIAEHKLRVIAPDVGGGFGSKLQVTAEEVLALLLARKLGRPVKWTESQVRGQRRRAPRPRPDPAAAPGRRRRRPHPRPRRGPARRHGRLPDARHAGRAAARRVHVQRDLQDGRLPVQLHRRVHHQDPDRRLPRRRPARGHLRHRAPAWTTWPPSSGWTRSSCASGTGSSTRSSRTPRSRG